MTRLETKLERLFAWWREEATSPREEWLRAQYSPLRSYFEAHVTEYEREQRWLAQAAIDTPVAEYLATTVRLAALAALLGFVGGAILAPLLAVLGILGVDITLLGWSVGLAILGAVVAGGGVGGGHYYYPRLVAYQRARRIDAMLPHAILFIYALVHSGTLPQEVVRELADAEDIYGEVAVEFDRFVTEVTWLGGDVYEGIDRAATRSPSDQLTAFFEEWGNLLELGGDIPEFLHEEVESQLERAEESQEQFLEQVETASEAYIVLIFAGPIFLLIALIVISFFSPFAMTLLQVLIYVFIPLGIGFFAWFFGHLIGPLQYSLGQVRFGARDAPRTAIQTGMAGTAHSADQVSESESLRQAVTETIRAIRTRNFDRIQQQPTRLFVLSIPLAVVVTAGLVLAQLVPIGWTPVFEQPVLTGSGLFVAPFVIATVPVAVVHEWNQRRMRRIRTRFPAALRVIADANRNGVPIVDSFAAVSERLGGPLGDELDRTYHDITWFHDIDAALQTFADRLAVPVISRLVYLLTESLRTTNDIGDIIDIVADDLEARNRLLEQRRERMQSYVFMVFIGVVVFLVVIALFDISFLPALARFTTEQERVLQEVPIRVGALEVDTYSRIFFHAALIQALGNGLILGRLEANSFASGLKYSNFFLLSVVALFFLI